MKKFALLLCAAALFPLLAFGGPEAGTGRYVVVFKGEKLPADAAARISGHGASALRLLPEVGIATVAADGTSAASIAKDPAVQAIGVERMHALPETLSAEVIETEVASTEAAPTPADSLWFYQWDMRRMNAPAVWARLPLAAAQPAVAVLDTGVAHNHPDLVGQVTVMKSTAYCSTNGGIPSAPSYPVYASYIDFDAYPTWTPGVSPCTPITPNYNAHGTHVAGTIAAKLGGGRVVGVAPDAKIWAYKVFDRYRYWNGVKTVDAVGAFDGPIFEAILDATHNGVPVISMSLGSYLDRSDSNDNASWLAWDRVAKYANRKGAMLVASSGNGGQNLNGTLAHIPSDLSTVLSTGATAAATLVPSGGVWALPAGQDIIASYSNYGAAVDVSAPGGDCPPSGPCQIQYFIVNAGLSGVTGALGYYGMAGTSMATPHVSAVAAHIRALHPDWTPGQVREHLKATAQIVGPRQFFGAGLVDADAATR